MSPIDRFLHCLNGVRQIGDGRWIARCPAHDDRTPSLSIREVEDRVLIHCFAGCDAIEIMAAVNLTLTDLFGQPLSHHTKPTRARIPASDRLVLIDHEALLVSIAATQVAQGEPLSDEDRDRLLVAAHRIGWARDGV